MRRIPLSRRSHVTGFRPLDGEAVEHESALERDFVLLTRFLDPSAAITAQPISFESEGRSRRYTPDFRVVSSRGSELVEILSTAPTCVRSGRGCDPPSRRRVRLASASGSSRRVPFVGRCSTMRGGCCRCASRRLIPLLPIVQWRPRVRFPRRPLAQ